LKPIWNGWVIAQMMLIKIDLDFNKVEKAKCDINTHVQNAENDHAPIASKEFPHR
jgi:hypothetical protein